MNRILYFFLLGMATSASLNAQERKYPPPNPEPVIAPGTDLRKGREPGLQKTQDHYIADRLSGLITAYAQATRGSVPQSWSQIEVSLGKGIWESPDEGETIKRRFAFINEPGNLPRASDMGPWPFDGELLLAPLYPVHEQRSQEEGRFTVWKTKNGRISLMWLTESELKTFSNWQKASQKLEAAKTQVARLPAMIVKTTPLPLPQNLSTKPTSSLASSSITTEGDFKSKPPSSPSLAAKEVSKEAHPDLTFIWIMAGAIALVFGGVFAWRKLSSSSS